ncbi:MAG: hypothetical protein QOJ32_1739, partial [Frankiaceae bacterium]|nr:hypothetical protein [Frankiaceae bacterium]
MQTIRRSHLADPSRSPLGRTAALTIAVTGAGVAWQQKLHAAAGSIEHGEPPPLLHWARDAGLALPSMLLAVVVAALASERLLRGRTGTGLRAAATGVAGALTLGLGVPVHSALFESAHHHAAELPLWAHILRDGLVSLPVTLLVASVVLFARVPRRLPARQPGLRPRITARGLLTKTVAVTLLAAPLTALTTAAPAVAADSGPCPTGARPISYDLAAFQNTIPLNGWGDKLANGLQYALRNSDARNSKDAIVANPNISQPLVVRANVGDCITVSLRNDIDGRRVGIHPDGLVQFDPKTSDGARVGNNPDTTAATGETKTYTWYADHTGEAPLVDIANLNDAPKPDVADPAGGTKAPDPAGTTGGTATDPAGTTGTKAPDPAGANPAKDLGISTTQLGLYGGIVVTEKGSTWHNPRTGADLLDESTGRAVETAWAADIRNAGTRDFRSFALVFMDENENVVDRNGQTPTNPASGLVDPTFGINYRSEPLRNRLRAILEYRAGQKITLPNGKTYDPTLLDPNDPTKNAENHFCDGYVPELKKIVDDPGAKCMSEESHLQSWVFGDESKLTRVTPDGVVTDSDNVIPKAYQGDPIRFHIIHPGAKETHPWHQHTQRWYENPNNTSSPQKDVQSISPGEAFPLEIEGGAGGLQKTVGDSIFHCHLYPHFAGGFWGHLRIFDRLRDGTQRYPDGTQLEPLQELPTRVGAVPAADATHPGFPLFEKGDVGQRAYRIPNAVTKDDFAAIRRPGDAPRGPTPLEAANLPGLDPTKPGAGYIDPCPTGSVPRQYRPHAVDTKLVYNNAGWVDKQGRIFVEESHKAAVLAGTEKPEPYTIRSRQGECMQINLTNDLHLDENPNVPLDHVNRLDGTFMTTSETSEVSMHVHLVRFDELGSDGTSVGWNYVQAAMPGQTYSYRWFVDVPLRTVFFHDHQYANLHQQKGLFSAMNIEPPDATWTNPSTGAPSDGTGTIADIHSPSGPDFREMTLFHQDRIPMWKDNGNGPPIAPPSQVDNYGTDQGGYALNYRNEPYQIRTKPGAPGLKGDPAYVQSSVVFGDPATPLFRAYKGDPVVIRNVVGGHEEIHTFNLHGHRWFSQPDNPNSTLVDTQTVGLAEWFNYDLQGGKPRKRAVDTATTLDNAGVGTDNGAPRLVDAGAGKPGDYQYGSSALDDQWLGMWGIFRVPKVQVPDLKPLPDRNAPATGTNPWPDLAPGSTYPTKATVPANTCPTNAPLRTYEVNAITKDIVYNAKSGDHDPAGALYVLNSDEAAVRAGTKPTEPLMIRANAGDCLMVTLRNKLPTTGLPQNGEVPLPADAPFPAGNRVSMHPALLDYDVGRADGTAVGYNSDSTIGPGQTIQYFWYVPPKLDGSTINLVDFGDRRGNRHHGLFAGLFVEPTGSTWTDPAGAPAVTGTSAVISWTDATGAKKAFREFALDWEDGLNLRKPDGTPVPASSVGGDPYEQG